MGAPDLESSCCSVEILPAPAMDILESLRVMRLGTLAPRLPAVFCEETAAGLA